jgi:hypothetical protein
MAARDELWNFAKIFGGFHSNILCVTSQISIKERRIIPEFQNSEPTKTFICI